MSIATKLAGMAMVFIAVVGVLLAMVTLAFNITTGVRAFVTGEGLWSKGQKDAVYYLARYGI